MRADKRARFAGRPGADMTALQHDRADGFTSKLVGGRQSIDAGADDDDLGGGGKWG